MEELEAHIADIDDKLMIEHYKDENQLKREQVIQYFAHALKKEPMLLLQTLIQKIITYDDKLEIYYNYVEHMSTDTPPQDYSLGKGKIGCADSSQKCPPPKT